MNKKEKTPKKELQNSNEFIRIRKIKITKLFNMFEYDCDFDEDNDVSILIARNGCGKTTILNMIDFLFNPTRDRFLKICNIPFDRVFCELSNNKKLELIKRYTEDQTFVYKIGNSKMEMNIDSITQFKNTIFNNNTKPSRRAEIKPRFRFKDEALLYLRRHDYNDERFYNVFLSEIDRVKEERDRESLIYLQHILSQKIRRCRYEKDALYSEEMEIYLCFQELLNLLETGQKSKQFDVEYKALKDKLKEILGEGFFESFKDATNGLSVNYIPANRLFVEKNINNKFEEEKSRHAITFFNEENINRDVITSLNDDIKTIFAEKDKEYKDKQSEAKDIILERFLKDEHIRFSKTSHQLPFVKALTAIDDFLSPTTEENDSPKETISLKDLWDNYIKEIENLQKMGLIDSDLDKTLYDTAKGREKEDFLRVYIEEYQDTLNKIKPFYEQLKLFLHILNERNKTTRKTFSFSRVKGFVLKVGKKELPLECMSSGEKNDFVMFYDLIFKSQKGGLVLMDEPEISLHIEWQETILNSMFEICKMNNLQAIIATHSPHILNNHEELVLDGGPFYE